MNKQQVEITIVQGDHNGLKPFLFNLLRIYPELSKKNIEKILSDENMVEFKKAFTSPSANSDYKYEFYEMLGDSTSNNCVGSPNGSAASTTTTLNSGVSPSSSNTAISEAKGTTESVRLLGDLALKF